MVVMGWGVQMSGRGLGTESRCWRCLQEAVPDDDDHIGLCGLCISSLQDSPRSSRPVAHQSRLRERAATPLGRSAAE